MSSGKISMSLKNGSNGIFLIMMNANGWRNPGVYGGGEILTVKLVNRLREFKWFIASDSIFSDLIKKQAPNAVYVSIPPLFYKTNVLLDILQGLYFVLGVVYRGFKLRAQYSLVYASTTNFSDLLPSKMLSLITGKPLLVKYHISIYSAGSFKSIYLNYRKEEVGILDAFIRAFLAWVGLQIMKSSKVAVLSKTLADQLVKCGCNPENVYLNHSGLDFSELSKEKVDAEKEYDFVYMGRVEKYKGVFDLVDAVAKLPEARTLIIGDGNAMSELKEKIKELGLENRVLIKGFLGRERYKFLQTAKVFVQPSFANEGFGLSILEAVYFGLPVVLYRQPVFEEIFGKMSGVYFANRDVESLASTMCAGLKASEALKKDKISAETEIYSLESCASCERSILNTVVTRYNK